MIQFVATGSDLDQMVTTQMDGPLIESAAITSGLHEHLVFGPTEAAILEPTGEVRRSHIVLERAPKAAVAVSDGFLLLGVDGPGSVWVTHLSAGGDIVLGPQDVATGPEPFHTFGTARVGGVVWVVHQQDSVVYGVRLGGRARSSMSRRSSWGSPANALKAPPETERRGSCS